MSYANGERRSRVIQLLQGGTPRKLMRGELDDATEMLREAYQQANSPPPLESPWPEICAYRLAHVLLRQDPVNRATQQQVERLFAQASQSKALGPWPCLYQMALLQSLGKNEQLADLWETAYRRLGLSSGALDSTSAGLRGNQVTALELMACSAGLFSHLPRLSGRGLPLDDTHHPLWGHLFLGEDSVWRLFGPSPQLDQVAFPLAVARTELESLLAARPHGFFFILPVERPARCWHQSEWAPFSQVGLLELLAVTLALRKYDNASLAESLGVSDGALRVRKVELHNLLRARFPQIGEVPPYELDIFGIVQHGAIFRS